MNVISRQISLAFVLEPNVFPVPGPLILPHTGKGCTLYTHTDVLNLQLGLRLNYG